MLVVRKLLVILLSLVLLGATLGLAINIGLMHSIGQPKAVENWVNKSGLYDQLPAAINQQLPQSVNLNVAGQTTSLSLPSPVVKQALQSALPTSLLQADANKFIDANFAWFNNQTRLPSFSIDLSAAKTSFAQNISQYLSNQLAGRPTCSLRQLQQFQISGDLLSLSCLPPGIYPPSLVSQVYQQIANSGSFLQQPVITAQSINLSSLNNLGGSAPAQPYYQKLSWLPRLYRIAMVLPWFLGGLILLSLLGIIFIAPTHRHGYRRIAFTLALAGILLVAIRFLSGSVQHRLAQQISPHLASALQSPLSQALHFGIIAFVQPVFYIGLLYLIISVGLYGTLFAWRGRGSRRTG